MLSSEDIVLTYGKEVVAGFIPQEALETERFIPLILPKKLPIIKNLKEALLSALEDPIGEQKPLSELVKLNYKGNDVSIITDDHARPNVHTRLLLPILLELLTTNYKIPSNKIKIVIASGTHRAPTSKELKNILGIDLEKHNIIVHDCKENLAVAGKINDRIIKINKVVFDSDIIVPLTDVENHYFAGVAGGPKSFCPGICDKDTITYEHLHMFGEEGFAENVGLGMIDKNPVFEMKTKIVKEIIETLKKHKREVYTIVTIVDSDNDLVYLKGGEMFKAHRFAAEVLKKVWIAHVKRKPDLVLASASTWGINLYQAVKATHAAYRAVKKGGSILTIAPCTEGWGNEEFKNLMKVGMEELDKYKDKAVCVKKALKLVMDLVKKDFVIGKQKPVDIFQILNYVGYGNSHLIQDGIAETDYKLMPFVIYSNKTQPIKDRVRTWVERYSGDKTIAVLDNPGYLVMSYE